MPAGSDVFVAAKARFAEALFDRAAGWFVIVTSGGVCAALLTLKVLDAAAVLPAPSVAVAVIVCIPSTTDALFHRTEYGLTVTTDPRNAPSSRYWTPAIPFASEAPEVTLTVPNTVAPLTGV